MSDIFIAPSTLKGQVKITPSKSVLHRAVICAALADGESTIDNTVMSKDIEATLLAVNALGRKASVLGDCILAGGSEFIKKDIVIDCYESGSTLRFMIPLAGALGVNTTFTGRGRLPKRPLNEYTYLLSKNGLNIEFLSSDNLPLKISGKLISGHYKMRGDITSQYVTGLLLALPLLNGDSQIQLSTPLESQGYVDITMDVMRAFGVNVKHEDNTFYIKGNQSYKPCCYYAEGDWSQAAFWLCAGALGADVTVSGLNFNSKQGDMEIYNVLNRFGANITRTANALRVCGGNLKGIEIDVSQIPDLAPILAVIGAYAKGTTNIKNASRLRLKECDRLSTIVSVLGEIGADITEHSDSIEIRGKDKLIGGKVLGYNDHRIVMALSIAALFSHNGVKIEGCQCIDKSYPNFFEDLKMLGGITDGFKLW